MFMNPRRVFICFYKKLKSLPRQKNNCSLAKIIILPNFFVKDSVGQKLIINKIFTIFSCTNLHRLCNEICHLLARIRILI